PQIFVLLLQQQPANGPQNAEHANRGEQDDHRGGRPAHGLIAYHIANQREAYDIAGNGDRAPVMIAPTSGVMSVVHESTPREIKQSKHQIKSSTPAVRHASSNEWRDHSKT